MDAAGIPIPHSSHDEMELEPLVAVPSVGTAGSMASQGALFQPLEVEESEQVLLRSKWGNIVLAPEPQILRREQSNQDGFKGMLKHLTAHEDFSTIRYAQWIVLGFNNPASCQPIYDTLARSCDIVGVNVCGVSSHSAVGRRTNVKKNFSMPVSLGFNAVHTLKRGRQQDFNNLTVAFLQAWLAIGLHTKTNFLLKAIDMKDYSWRDLEKEWMGVPEQEVLDQILDAEELIAVKRAHTVRDVAIAKMGRKILSKRSDMVAGLPSYMVPANDDAIIPKCCFENLNTVVCRSVNVPSGRIMDYTLDDWCEHGMKAHTLILYGDSDLGKTELAKTLMCEVAMRIQQGESWQPYIIKTETVDSLKAAADAGHVGPTIPILFDEIKIGARRGTRAAMDVEDAKRLCEVRNSTTIDARFKDIKIPQGAPRCFTCNASEPSGWLPLIPQGLFTMTDAMRQDLPADVKAVLKRTAFAHVSVSVVPQPLRDEYHARSSGASSSGSVQARQIATLGCM